jgi:hypothetical protein
MSKCDPQCDLIISDKLDGISCLYVRRVERLHFSPEETGSRAKHHTHGPIHPEPSYRSLANQDIIVRGELSFSRRTSKRYSPMISPTCGTSLPDVQPMFPSRKSPNRLYCRVRNSVTLRSNEVIRAAPAHEDYGHSHYRQSVARHIRFNPDYVQGS